MSSSIGDRGPSVEMSKQEFHELIKSDPQLTQSEITFVGTSWDADSEAEIREEYAPAVSAIQDVMSDLTANERDCVRNAIAFAYKPYRSR